jgi:hypothetical protein
MLTIISASLRYAEGSPEGAPYLKTLKNILFIVQKQIKSNLIVVIVGKSRLLKIFGFSGCFSNIYSNLFFIFLQKMIKD